VVNVQVEVSTKFEEDTSGTDQGIWRLEERPAPEGRRSSANYIWIEAVIIMENYCDVM
jgi:hypothetical protein